MAEFSNLAPDYAAEAQLALTRLRKLAFDPDIVWRLVRDDENGVRILAAETSDAQLAALGRDDAAGDFGASAASSSLLVARVEAEVDASPEAILNLLMDESHAVEINDNLLDAAVLERDPAERYVVAYRRYKRPMLVFNQRDTVYVKAHERARAAGEPTLYASKSVVHLARPVETGLAAAIRLQTFVTGAVLRPGPDGTSTSICYLSKVDYGGVIPLKLVNWGISRYAKRVTDIRALFASRATGDWYRDPANALWMGGEPEALRAMATKTVPFASHIVSQTVGQFASLVAVYTITRAVWCKLRVTVRDPESGHVVTVEPAQGTLAHCEQRMEEMLHGGGDVEIASSCHTH